MSDLDSWVAGQLSGAPTDLMLTPVSGDAGFRRYYRLQHGGTSLVVMDASADRGSCAPFMCIDALLVAGGVRVPRILACDLQRGFLLLEDLGSRTLLEMLDTADTAAAEHHYAAAIEALVGLQRITPPPDLPRYDEALLRRELALFEEWYLSRHRGISLDDAQRQVLQQGFDRLVERALAQATVLVHRDFMPRNLMPQTLAGAAPGVLDFQDAVVGPVSYDPICLFKDAFISWPETRVADWLNSYWRQACEAGVPVPSDFERFQADCDFMGAQRHLKVIGIFARLCHRDGKSRYLDDVPRFFAYLDGACNRQPALAPLGALLRELTP